jgi:hypothetical protein
MPPTLMRRLHSAQKTIVAGAFRCEAIRQARAERELFAAKSRRHFANARRAHAA